MEKKEKSNEKKGVKKVLLVHSAHYATTNLLAGKFPLEYLKASGDIKSIKIKVPEKVQPKDIEEADLVYIIRRCDVHAQKVCLEAAKKKKPVVYYVDDNFFVFPEDANEKKRKKIEKYREILSMVDKVIVSTRDLRETVEKYTKKVTVLSSYQIFLKGAADRTDDKERPVVTIGHMSTIHRDKHFMFVIPAIKKIIEEFGEKVRFEFIGYKPTGLEKYKNVRFYDFMKDYMKFQKFLTSRKWDIGLAPLMDSAFSRSKSNIKFREYSAQGICGIYSNIRCYTESVQPGVTGIIAGNTPEAWYEAMRALILNSGKRRNMAGKAYRYVKENCAMEDYCKQLMDIFNKEYHRKNPKAADTSSETRK